MAISLASLRATTALRPPRILVHGVAGIGKTTFAAGADDPVVVMTEDGLGMLQVPHSRWLGAAPMSSRRSTRC